MDLVLLVIAADEGIMPQTIEHIEILNLLGCKNAIVVLNKIDLVDTDWANLIESDIKDKFKNTILSNSPIVRVSSINGTGINDLINQIENTSAGLSCRNCEGLTRLPIDRIFSIKGSGTIITGTLVAGSINIDDELEIFPINKKVKIRSIQIHNQTSNKALAGQRVALNLKGIDKEDIYRGCVVANIDSIHPTDNIIVRINILPSYKRTIKNGSRLHFFSGTSKELCKLILLDSNTLNSGQTALAQLRFDKKIAIKRGDKFIVRFYSPLETIGGGTVIEANAKIIKRFDKTEIDKLLKIESGSIDDNILTYIDEVKEPTLSYFELAKKSATNKEEIVKIIEKLKSKNKVSIYTPQSDEIIWSNHHKLIFINNLTDKLKEFHCSNPYKLGMFKAEIQNKYFKNTKSAVFDCIIDELTKNKIIKSINEYICNYDFKVSEDEVFKKIEQKTIGALDKAGFNFVRFDDINFSSCDEKYVEDIRDYLKYEGKIVKVSDNLYTLPKYADIAKKEICNILKKNGKITIAEVRDLFNTSRKSAKPILEYTDSIGITRRTGAEAEREAGVLEADR